MKQVLTAIQIIVSLLLIGLIILQSSKGGLGGGLGGGELYRTKRGAERIVFILTIVCSVLFLITAIANLLVY